jgi:hypothetical protein
MEEQVLKLLKQYSVKGFPRLLNYGYHDKLDMDFLVINKGDIDLETLFEKLNRRFQKQTVINIGIQLVSLSCFHFHYI